jgi:hypothetical protein
MDPKQRVEWTEQEARKGEMRNDTASWAKSLKEKDHSEDLGVDGIY